MTERRSRLLEAAAEQFARYGFRKTSIEEVTRAAGVSKGSLYLEFASKEELFDALVRYEFRAYLADADLRIAADPEGGRLSRIYHHCIQALLQRDFLLTLYTQDERILAGLLHRRGPQRYRPRVLLGAQFIERMQRAGLIDANIAPERLSHTLSILMLGPLLAEPILHSSEGPTLGETFTALSSMIVTSFETGAGDTDEGKRAFADLRREISALLATPSPS